MKLRPEGWRRLFRIWRRSPAGDVDAELAFHFDERIAELVDGGIPAAEARAKAAAEFGDVTTIRRGLVAIDSRLARRRDAKERWEWIGQDLRYVVRSLRRSPGFVVMVSLTLALGLGVNVAIFSVLDRLFLSPPPGIPHPETIRRLYRINPGRPDVARRSGNEAAARPTTQPVFDDEGIEELRRAAPTGTLLAGYSHDEVSIGDGTAAIDATYVLGDYFRLLGVQVVAGRSFSPDETRIDAPGDVAIVSERFVTTQMGGMRDPVGSRIDIDGHRCVVVGVVGGGFHGADGDGSEVWLPMGAERWKMGGAPDWFRSHGGGRTFFIHALVGALTPQLAAEIEHTAATVFRSGGVFPDSLASARLAPLTEMPFLGRESDRNLQIATRLAAVSVIILLIACANVSNLLFARGLRRRREFAVRLALGVSRSRLIGLLLIESLVVSLTGAMVAIAVALWAGAALRNTLIPDVHWMDAPVNVHVLLFALALALLAGIGAGLLPAIRASRPDLAAMLKGSAREGTHARSTLRTSLLVTQSALAVVLLAGAGVFVRSLRSVETQDLGVDADRLIYASIDRAPGKPALPDHGERLAIAADRLRLLPGVERVALANGIPMWQIGFEGVKLPGRDSLPRVAASGPFATHVSPQFFSTVGMRVLAGRGFTVDDRAEAPLAIIVNQAMAQSLWPGESALGRCLLLEDNGQRCTTVVGVVSDAHAFRLVEEQPAMQFYLPLARAPGFGSSHVLVIRAAPGRSESVADAVRRNLRGAETKVGRPDVRRMTENLAGELRPWRTGAMLFASAGLLALLVAIVGMYGTISYAFSQRTHEMGVRMALGARAGNVARMVVGAGMRVVCVGIVIGVLLTLAAGRLVDSMLYHTSTRDPLVLAVVSGVLLLVTVGACLVPAWRALRVDPAIALRAD